MSSNQPPSKDVMPKEDESQRTTPHVPRDAPTADNNPTGGIQVTQSQQSAMETPARRIMRRAKRTQPPRTKPQTPPPPALNREEVFAPSGAETLARGGAGGVLPVPEHVRTQAKSAASEPPSSPKAKDEEGLELGPQVETAASEPPSSPKAKDEGREGSIWGGDSSTSTEELDSEDEMDTSETEDVELEPLHMRETQPALSSPPICSGVESLLPDSALPTLGTLMPFEPTMAHPVPGRIEPILGSSPRFENPVPHQAVWSSEITGQVSLDQRRDTLPMAPLSICSGVVPPGHESTASTVGTPMPPQHATVPSELLELTPGQIHPLSGTVPCPQTLIQLDTEWFLTMDEPTSPERVRAQEDAATSPSRPTGLLDFAPSPIHHTPTRSSRTKQDDVTIAAPRRATKAVTTDKKKCGRVSVIGVIPTDDEPCGLKTPGLSRKRPMVQGPPVIVSEAPRTASPPPVIVSEAPRTASPPPVIVSEAPRTAAPPPPVIVSEPPHTAAPSPTSKPMESTESVSIATLMPPLPAAVIARETELILAAPKTTPSEDLSEPVAFPVDAPLASDLVVVDPLLSVPTNSSPIVDVEVAPGAPQPSPPEDEGASGHRYNLRSRTQKATPGTEINRSSRPTASHTTPKRKKETVSKAKTTTDPRPTRRRKDVAAEETTGATPKRRASDDELSASDKERPHGYNLRKGPRQHRSTCSAPSKPRSRRGLDKDDEDDTGNGKRKLAGSLLSTPKRRR